ncbi:Crp/Fnr family transcriptional regulator [Parasphingorhabdus halotolerans]|uniref:Crp/Fnr family transcriptional regulator n=1 Tax=Parasphingorhabdus halotolerans TaxID=2725558 RepID=A0A6H2DPA0_9SPHN|nr:Crp/Fnr family transcriptional regulator [Parasphingorhabdus halotolerans]QJB70489.1 Crp/Fnr family transcriptional regulator [Parasphingorhabdus halotolerans]
MSDILSSKQQLLTRYFSRRKYASKEMVAYPDDEISQKAFVVTEGVFRVFLPFEDGQEIVKKFLLPGDAGITPYQADGTFVVSCVEAVTAGEIAIAPLDDVLVASQSDPQLMQIINFHRENQISEKAQREIDSRRLGAKERYLKVVDQLGQWADQVPLFEIASLIGISPVHLSRIRKELRQTVTKQM